MKGIVEKDESTPGNAWRVVEIRQIVEKDEVDSPRHAKNEASNQHGAIKMSNIHSLHRRRLVAGALALAGPSSATWLRAQTVFPSKSITLLVPYPPGGATDVQARALAHAASKTLKQPIVIMNQPGVSATLAPASMAQRATPDGYTLSLMISNIYRLPHLQKVNYDIPNDFTYICNVTGATLGISVRPDARWKDMKALLADAKSRPGEISYGSAAKGGTSHVAMERLAHAAGVKFNYIPFKGAAEMYNALMGGHLDVAAEAGFGNLVAGGRGRLLAIFNDTRLKARPEVPTIKELGYDIVATGSWGITGPKGMQPQVVQILQEAFRKATDDPEFLRVLDMNDYTKGFMDAASYRSWALKTYADEKLFVEQLNIRIDG